MGLELHLRRYNKYTKQGYAGLTNYKTCGQEAHGLFILSAAVKTDHDKIQKHTTKKNEELHYRL